MCVPGYPFRPLQPYYTTHNLTYYSLLLSLSLPDIPTMSFRSHVDLDPPVSILRFLHLASFAASLINPLIYVPLRSAVADAPPGNSEVRSRPLFYLQHCNCLLL